MTPIPKRRKIASSLILLSMLFTLALASATTENNYNNTTLPLTKEYENTLTENDYTINILIHTEATGYTSNENNYKIDLGIYSQDTGLQRTESGYTLDIIPQKAFPEYYGITIADLRLATLYKVNLYVSGTFAYGNCLKVKFYSYHGAYQGETLAWNITTPAYMTISTNASHPLNWPTENATLVLTDKQGNTIQTITSLLVHRTHLFDRTTQIDARWLFASLEERAQLFIELVDIDGQWPYAPP